MVAKGGFPLGNGSGHGNGKIEKENINI